MTRRKRAIDEHYIRKASDETVNDSSTYQNDDDLKFAVGTNETWLAIFVIRFTTGSTPDIKFQLSIPSGTSGGLFSGIALDGTTYASFFGSVAVRGPGGAEATAVIHVTLRTSGTGGNAILQWAQNTANASDTKVLADSSLMAWRLD